MLGMARTWRCQRVKQGVKCATDNPRIKQRCTTCGGKRPTRVQPAHRAALDEMTYVQCVAEFGEECGICGAGPGTRRLHRDHEHKGGGAVRGLLCFRCNAALRIYMTLEWLRSAVAYLERFEARRQG
jgi:Recombination endonuclease VII